MQRTERKGLSLAKGRAVVIAWMGWSLIAADAVRCAADETVRVITTGWHMPTVRQFTRDAKFVLEGPLDGAGIRVRAAMRPSDPLTKAFTGGRWDAAAFAETEAALDRIDPADAASSYLVVNANPGDADWFDDDVWRDVVDHCRSAARLARRGHFRGLIFDPEPYEKPYAQFQYSAQSGAADHSFADYAAAARRRGGEVMRAVGDEFPGVEMLSYFWMSYLVDDHPWRGPTPLDINDSRRVDFDSCLDGHRYGLLPAFLSGMLEAADKDVVFIDGCENGYWFESREAFVEHADRVRRRGRMIVDEDVRSKYDAQMRVAFPVYMDIIDPEVIPAWTNRPHETDRMAVLNDYLRWAIGAGDGLVWIYGESHRWWPPPGETAAYPNREPPPPWTERYPDVLRVIEDAKATRPGSLRETVDVKPPMGPPPYPAADADRLTLDAATVWSREETTPEVDSAGDRTVIRGAKDTGVLREFDAEPGQRFIAGTRVQQVGSGLVQLVVRWRDESGRWITTAKDRPGRRIDATGHPAPGNPSDWRPITVLAIAPEKTRRGVLIEVVRDQVTRGDAVTFRDAVVVRADGNEPPIEDVGATEAKLSAPIDMNLFPIDPGAGWVGPSEAFMTRLDAAMKREVNVKLKDVSLSEFASEMSRSAGVPVRLDHAALGWAGLDPNDAISVDVRQTPIESVFASALRNFDLTLAIVEPALVITTPDVRDEQPLTRVYEVAERSRGYFDEAGLTELIMTHIQPDGWPAGNFHPSVVYTGGKVKVVLSLPYLVHRQLERLLNQLAK